MAFSGFTPDEEMYAITSANQRRQLASNARRTPPQALANISHLATGIRTQYPWLEAGVVSTLAQGGFGPTDMPTRVAAVEFGLPKILGQKGVSFAGPDPNEDALIKTARANSAQIMAEAAAVQAAAKAVGMPKPLPAGRMTSLMNPTAAQDQSLAQAGQTIGKMMTGFQSGTAQRGAIWQTPDTPPGMTHVVDANQVVQTVPTSQAHTIAANATSRAGETSAGAAQGMDDPFTAAVKSVTKYGFAAMMAPWQAFEAEARGLAGNFASGDPGQIGLGILKAVPVTTPLAVVGEQVAGGGPDLGAQTTLGQIAKGKDPGQGFFPGGEANMAQAAAARAGGPTIEGHALTPGRLIAAAATETPGVSQLADIATAPARWLLHSVAPAQATTFNVISGLVDAAAIIKGDPVAAGLKSFGEARQAANAVMPSGGIPEEFAQTLADNVAHDQPSAVEKLIADQTAQRTADATLAHDTAPAVFETPAEQAARERAMFGPPSDTTQIQTTPTLPTTTPGEPAPPVVPQTPSLPGQAPGAPPPGVMPTDAATSQAPPLSLPEDTIPADSKLPPSMTTPERPTPAATPTVPTTPGTPPSIDSPILPKDTPSPVAVTPPPGVSLPSVPATPSPTGFPSQTELQAGRDAGNIEPPLPPVPGQPASAAGAFHGPSPEVNVGSFADWWLHNPDSQPVHGALQALSEDPNPTQGAANMWRLLSQRSQFPVTTPDGKNVIAALMGAPDDNARGAVLSQIVGPVTRDVPRGDGALWALKQSTTDRFRILGMSPDHTVNISDPTGTVNNMDRVMLNAKVPLEQRNQVIGKFLLSDPSKFTPYSLIDDTQHAVYQSLIAHGTDPQTARDMTSLFRQTAKTNGTYLTHAENDPVAFPITKVGGEQANLADMPMLSSESLQNVEIPNLAEIKRATSWAAPFLQNPAIENTRTLLDRFNNFWKSGRVMQPKLVAKVLTNNYAWMAAHGLDTPFNHPLRWLSLVAGENIDHPFLQRLAGYLPTGTLESRAEKLGANVDQAWESANQTATRLIDTLKNPVQTFRRYPGGADAPVMDTMPYSPLTPNETKLATKFADDPHGLAVKLYHDQLTGALTTNIGHIRGPVHLGVPWDMNDAEQYDLAQTMKKIGQGYQPQMNRIYFDGFDKVGRTEPRWSEGVVTELRQLHTDPLARAATRYTPDELKAAMTDGELSHFRRDMVLRFPRMADGDPQQSQEIGNWVNALYDRLDRQTHGDPFLHQVIRSGKWGDGELRLTNDFAEPDKTVMQAIEERGQQDPTFAGDLVKVPRYQDMTTGITSHRIMSAFFREMVAKPLKTLMAMPAYQQLYVKRLQEVFPYIPAGAERDAALINARDLGVPRQALRNLVATQPVVDSAAHPYALTLQQAGEVATSNTHDDFINMIHDLSTKAQASQSLRMVFPFADAWRQIGLKWIRTLRDEPQVAYRLMQGDAAAHNAGIIYKDPATGEQVFAVPGTAALSGMLGDPIPLQGKVSGLSMVGEGLPGVGPVVKIPMAALLPYMQHAAGALGATQVTGPLNALSKQLFPYGNPLNQGTGPTTGALSLAEEALPVPASVTRLADTFFHNPQTFRDMATITARVMQYKASTGQYDLHGPNAAQESNRLLHDSMATARYVNVLRAIAGSVIPTSLIPDYKVKDPKGNLVTAQIVANDFRSMEAAHNGNLTDALTQFIGKYGADNVLATIPLNIQTKGFLPSTDTAQQWLANNPKYRELAPNVYGYFAPQPTSPNDFSQSAFSAAFGRGEETPRSAQDFLAAGNARVGTFLYDKATAGMGNTPDEAAWKQQVRDRLTKLYPGYNASTYDYKKTPNLANEIRQAISDSPNGLGKTQAGSAAKQWFAQYDGALADAKAAGYKSINNKASAATSDWLFQYGVKLSKDSPDFKAMWDFVLSHLVKQLPATNASGTAFDTGPGTPGVSIESRGGFHPNIGGPVDIGAGGAGNASSTSNDPPRIAFAKDLLSSINAPVNAETLDAMVTWMGREQSPAEPTNAAFNPLNVQTGPNQVQFPTWDAGVKATAGVIGQPNMAVILNAFQQGQSAQTILNAVQSSPWASSRYDGTLVQNLDTMRSQRQAWENATIAGYRQGKPGASSANNTVGGFTWPFQTKVAAQSKRTDEGWDLQGQPGEAVLAVGDGVVGQANPNPGGFGNDYPFQMLDAPLPGGTNPSNTLYYGHIHVLPNVVGQHVTAGTIIGYTSTNANENGSASPPGWLELGFARSGTGSPIAGNGGVVAQPIIDQLQPGGHHGGSDKGGGKTNIPGKGAFAGQLPAGMPTAGGALPVGPVPTPTGGQTVADRFPTFTEQPSSGTPPTREDAFRAAVERYVIGLAAGKLSPSTAKIGQKLLPENGPLWGGVEMPSGVGAIRGSGENARYRSAIVTFDAGGVPVIKLGPWKRMPTVGLPNAGRSV